ncbi:MAG: pyridoxamine 5'-phosphate oxidase family protein [Paraprevotella sp.]|nr:pyridoxamine 5'-phosphate oxidase family protein [Paraprevotella sp.]
MHSDLMEKAELLLADCCLVTIVSINSEGFPRPVPMAKGATQGCNVVWMATGTDSVKVDEFRHNPKAGLCYEHGGSGVSLRGTVEIITDDAIRSEMWQDWYIEHFPGGPSDPNYLLLKFTGDEATVWIDRQFAHLKI